MDLMDLQGRSGAVYRFRAVPSAADLPAHAGNFVLARATPGRPEVIACGCRRSLLELSRSWATLTSDGAQVYVRLNVSRAARLAEHEDLMAALGTASGMRETD